MVWILHSTKICPHPTHPERKKHCCSYWDHQTVAENGQITHPCCANTKQRTSSIRFKVAATKWHQIQAESGSVYTTGEKLIQFSSNPGWMRVSVHYTWETDLIFIKYRLDQGVYTTGEKLIQFSSNPGWTRVSIHYTWETDLIFIKYRLDQGVYTTGEKLIQFLSNPGWIRVSVHYTWETDLIFIKSRLDEGQCPLHMRNWSNFHQVQAGSGCLYYMWETDPIFIKYRLDLGVYTTCEKLIQFSSSTGWIWVFILHVRNWSNFHQVQAGSGSLYYMWETDPIFIKYRLDQGQFILHMRNWSNFHQVQAGSGSVYTTHGKLIQFSNSVKLETAVPASSLLLLHDSLPVKDKPSTSGCIVEFIQIQDYWEQVF